MFPGIIASSTYPFKEFLDGDTDNTNRSTYTFAISFGDAAPDRYISVFIAVVESFSDNSINSVTIGGVAATIDPDSLTETGGSISAFASALVPSGTSGNVVVSLSATAATCSIAAYSVRRARSGVVSADAQNNGGGSDSPPNLSLAVPGNGLVLAGMACDENSNITLGNVDEDYEPGALPDNARVAAGSRANLAANAAYSISGTQSDSADKTLSGVAWF